MFAPGQMEYSRTVKDPDLEHAGAERAVCVALQRALAQHYPGHPWGVRADLRNGVAYVMLGGFTHWGVVLHIADLKAEHGMKSAIRLAGQFLERLDMPRAGFSLDDWRAALARFPTHRQRRMANRSLLPG